MNRLTFTSSFLSDDDDDDEWSFELGQRSSSRDKYRWTTSIEAATRVVSYRSHCSGLKMSCIRTTGKSVMTR